jgi:hypothetical protein
MEQQSDLRFYSSSLLFVCDGIEEKEKQPQISLRMIDFAHVFPIKDGGKDDCYLIGLRNLIKIMQNLIEHQIEINEEHEILKDKNTKENKNQAKQGL